jgi:hypothetical protein
MLHKFYVSTIVGAVASLVMIPAGLAQALPVLMPMCCIAGAGIAALLYFVSHPPASGGHRLRCFCEFTATDNALVLGAIIVLALTVIIPSVLHAREAARRTMVKNGMRNSSHACHGFGNLVRLDENGNVDGISLADCPICRIAQEQLPFSDRATLIYVDATGQVISSGDVPAGARRVAESRFRYLHAQRDNGWTDPRPFPGGTYFVREGHSNSSSSRFGGGRVFVPFVD